MDTSQREELHRIWLKYLDAASSKEGELLLDVFLSKFIHLACQEESSEKVKESCWGWRNASNVLAHQLLVKMYQICNEMTSSVSSDLQDDSHILSSTPLQKYLLEGQGWNLLWTLEIMGLKNLSCTKDLVNLLIAHMPVALSFAVLPSEVPDFILKKYPGSLKEIPAVPLGNTSKNIMLNKSTKRHHIITASKLSLRQRTAKGKKNKDSDSSSFESDSIIPPKLSTFPFSHQSLQKANSTNTESTKVEQDSLIGDSESEIMNMKEVLSSPEFKSYQNFSLSVISYVKYVLCLLEKIAESEQKNWLASMSSSQSIAVFALESLKLIQIGHYEFSGWPEIQVKNLRNSFLRLIIQSTTIIKSAKGLTSDFDVIETLKVLLTISSSLPVSDNLNEKRSPQDVQFVSSIATGVLRLISHIVDVCCNDLAKVISAIRAFSSCEGVKIICTAISQLEQLPGFENHVSGLLLEVKKIIISLKTARTSNLHQSSSRDSFCSELEHHHSDTLGSVFSHSTAYTEPLCCVAAMSHLMLKLYKSLSLKSTMKLTLRMIREMGMCCCLEPNFVMSNLFSNFSSHDSDQQQQILTVLEKSVFPQLGLTPIGASSCPICLERQVESKDLTLIPETTLSFALNKSLEKVLQPQEDMSKWRCLNVYSSLLDLETTQSLNLVIKHINRIFTSLSTCVKKELFVRAVFPSLMKLVFELRKGNCLNEDESSRLRAFLALLPQILSNDSIAGVFIQFGGIRIICDIMPYSQFCSDALKCMKVLVLMEIKLQNESYDISLLYVPESAFSGLSSMVTFFGILSKYVKVFLKDLNKISDDCKVNQIANADICNNFSQSLRFDDPMKEGNFKGSLNFLCDLWAVCKDILLKVPSSCIFFNSSTITISYSLFISLLQNTDLFSNFNDAELFQHFLLLVKYLFMAILQFEASAHPAIQTFPSKAEILKVINHTIYEDHPSRASDLELLLDTLLQCSFLNSDATEDDFVIPKDSTAKMNRFIASDDFASSSDDSDYDQDPLYSSYDGDTERSDSEDLMRSAPWTTRLHNKIIKHGDLVKMVLRLSISFSAKIDKGDWTSMLTHILQSLISVCRESEINKSIICEQGICLDLLKGFHDVLISSEIEFKELQKAVTELFAIAAQYSMGSDDLRTLIEICKSSSAPFTVIMETFKSIIDTTPIWPYFAVSFPCVQKRVKFSKSENLKKYEPFLVMYHIYSRSKMNNLPSNAWSSAASVLPMIWDNKWSVLRKDMSLMLWLMVEKPQKSYSIQDPDSFSMGEDREDDGEFLYHLLSVGSNATLLEIWINSKKMDIIFRLNTYSDGNIVSLAEATCKGVFEESVWHHLSLNIKEVHEKKKVSCKIQLMVDGLSEHIVFLNYNTASLKTDITYFILLGHSAPQTDDEQKTSNCFYLSSLTLFKGEAITRDVAFYLANLGPSITNISHCVLGDRKLFLPRKVIPNIFDQGFDINLLGGLSIPSLDALRKNILLSYSAEKPTICSLYPQPTRIMFPLLAPFSAAGNFSIISQNDRPSQQEPSLEKFIFLANQKPVQQKSVFTAMHHVGGITVFLFLFARVIEGSTDAETQAQALQVFLKVTSKNCESADYFLKISGDHIIRLLLNSKKCLLSLHMLKVLLDHCLSGDTLTFVPWTNEWKIDYKNDVIITRPLFWILVVKTIFHCESCSDEVRIYLFRVIKELLLDSHPYLKFNAQQMKSVQMLESLLFILKDFYILADRKLPMEIATDIPDIIKKLFSKPLDYHQLWSLCDFLLLLHRTSHTYVCHAKSAFYFLFAKNAPAPGIQKEKVLLSDSTSDGTFSSTDSTRAFSSNASVSLGNRKYRPLRNVKSMTDLQFADTKAWRFQRMSSDSGKRTKDSAMIADFAATRMEQIYHKGNKKSSEMDDSGVVTNISSNIGSNEIDGEGNSADTTKKGILDQKADTFDSKIPEGVTVADDELDLDRTEINLGLLNLVRDIMMNSDEDSRLLILDIVRPDVFIVLAYNPVPRISHAAIEIIHAYLQFASEEKISDFLSLKGFHLLANQVHHMPADPLIIGAFFNLMFFGTHAAEDYTRSNLSKNVAITLQSMSTIPLLSLLPNTNANLGVCNSILSAISHLITDVPNSVSDLVHNGLCESIVHLILRIYHTSEREETFEKLTTSNTEKDIVFTSIFSILRNISSNLFSSKDVSDFDAFTSLLHLLCDLELQCNSYCDRSCGCVECWRNCQCIVFQAALDFIELYNYTQLKDDVRSDIEDASLWEILMSSMPDGLNPYSTFIGSSNSITSRSKNVRFSQGCGLSTSDSEVTLLHVEKATKELPMTDASDRFRFLLDKAADFVVFRDHQDHVNIRQKSLFRSLYHSIVRGFSTVIEISSGNKKTRWSAVVSPAKDVLRQQLNRLLITTLALDDDVEQKIFTLELLTKQPNFTDVMSSAFFNTLKLETFHAYLSELNRDHLLKTWHHRRIFEAVFSQHCLMMDSSGIDVSLDDEHIKMVRREWKDQWVDQQQIWLNNQLSTQRKMQKKLDKLAKQISEVAMDVTKRVVDLQSIERKKFMEEVKLKNSEEVSTRDIWRSLIEQLTHERAIWHFKDLYPCSWELDPTEGPHRIRKRLRRCHLDVNSKFVLPQFRKNISSKDVELPFVDLIEHGQSDSALVINKLHANEKIEHTCPCKVVTPFEEAKGEILIGDHFLHFIGEETKMKQVVVSERWPFPLIKEIILRRFELRNSAFEIFMKNGLTFLVAFYTTKELENVWKRLETRKLPCITVVDTSSLTQLWCDRSITNFEYITQLNKLAGRSFNDLMQYPVFPFILSDYSSSSINLNDSATYRILSRPVAVQNKNREEYYIKVYNSLKDELITGPISGPYHYGSHYSNSGTVLHFLVRLLPYTYGLIHYQDNSFDIPDRTFHSIDTSWQLVTKNSFSDVKELIPEFFFLPEFLCNKNGFALGLRQCGTQVDDVILPPWCKNDPRLFTLVHQQALESACVTNTLNSWIDLVFGFKQTGTAAINSINLFHPATYYGMDISKLEDHITRDALHATIKTVGQMPRQLFHNTHAMVSLSLGSSTEEDNSKPTVSVLDTVHGLKWGSYVGSPATPRPNMIWRCKQPIPIGILLSIFTNDVFGLQQNVCLLLNHSRDKSPSMSTATYIRSAALISWSYEDGIVRIKFCRDHPPVPLINGNSVDPVCLCASVPDCNELFIAHKSGTIFVYNCDVDSSKFIMTENCLPVQLTGHTATVTSICICKAFSIVVTASEDKTCIIWDLNKLRYVRSIYGHKKAVKIVCVSDTLGDIASISDNEDSSCLKVHTINGDLVGSVNVPEIVTALCYSTVPEGVSVNVIATGTAVGSICLWSSWDLKPLREIREEKFFRPITCMTFSIDNQHLYAANVDGTVAVWEKPSKMLLHMPRFLLFT